MKRLLLLMGLIALTSTVESDCIPEEKKLVMKYEQCLRKGYRSKLGCHFNNKKPSKKTKKGCSKIEKKLSKFDYECKEEYTLRATCDNMMTVYVDGVQQHAGEMDNWRKESVLSVSPFFKTISIACVDMGGEEGLLASLHNAAGVEVLVTDSLWSCSGKEEKGWIEPNFKGTSGNWEPADVIGPHGMSPWKKIGEISDDAMWIWTKTRSAFWAKEQQIFCRYTSSE
jgi:hypothetical protein